MIPRVRRVAAGVLVLLVAVAGAMPALGQEEGEEPTGGAGSNLGGYRANTAGSAISFRPVFPALLPTGDAPVEVTLGLSTATVSSGGNSFGQSSVLYPGAAAANLGPLLKQVGPPEIAALLPAYPLVVEASAKDGEIVKGAPPAVVMRANGRSDRGEGETRLSDIKFPGILEIDEMATVSRSLVTASEVTSITETTLTGVRALTNNITAKSIRSFASTTSNGRVASHDGLAEVTGLKIGGLDATLRTDGVHFTGLPSDAGQVPGAGPDPFPGENPDEVLTQLLETLGAEIRLTRAVGNAVGGAADSIAQGVFLSIENPVGGVAIPGLDIPVPPGRIEFLLASTSAAAQASPPFQAGLPEITPTDTDTDFTSPGSTSGPLVSGANESAGPVLSGLPGGTGLTPTGGGIDYDFDGLSLALVLGLFAAAVVVALYLRRFISRVALLGE